MSATSRFGLCGPDCTYKPLYLGSQASLNNMSSQQAVALGRVARLRDGVIDAMKKTYPVEFADAERVNGRMSRADDEMVLAYLSGFLAMPPSATAANTALAAASRTDPAAGAVLDPLRRALAECGVRLPAGDDPTAWADAVRRWGATQAAPQVAVTPPEQAGQAPQVRVSANRIPVIDPGPDPEQFAHEPSWAEQETAPTGWADLFGEDEALPEPGPEPSWDGRDDGALVSFGDEPPADVAPPRGSDALDLGDPAADPADLTSLFDDDPIPTSPPATTGAPTPAAPEPAPTVAPEATGAPEPQVLTAGSLAEVMRLQQAKTASTPANPANPAAAPATTTAQEAPTEPASQNKTSRTAGPVKPELFPAPAKTTKKAAPRPPRRTTRVSATAPDAGADPSVLAKAAEGGQLTQALHEQLVAAVCIPRPVFTSDLAHMVGDAALVDQWEQQCRSLGTASPLRFIMAKPRHRERGNLVLPFDKALRKAATEFDKSLWSRCLTELKGAKLYEVAVLLHRFSDQIVTAEVKANTVTLRINQQRGLVGVVVVLDSDLDPGDDTRTALATEVEDLLATRLSLLAVVTSAAGAKALTDLADALRAEATERSWSVTAPVIAAHSWDFASDGGTSAVSVLG